MSGPNLRTPVAFLAGLGVSLVLGGLIAAAAILMVAIQVGILDVTNPAWSDPGLLILAAFVAFSLAFTAAGAFCCRRAYTMFKTSGRPDKAGPSYD